MIIHTKLNHGQPAFTIYEGKVYEGTVRNIQIEVTQTGKIKISYVLGGSHQSPATYGRDECDVFASKEELLNQTAVKV